MAKGQIRSSKEKRKPKADAKKKSTALASPLKPAAVPAGKEPSEMYKLFTRNRSF